MRLPQPGTVFAGEFQVLSAIARGSTAIVYEVASPSIPGRLVLKLLLGTFAEDPRSLRRLEREAAAGVEISPQYIARTHATGVDEASGLPWLVMDYVPGRDLGKILAERGALPTPIVSRVTKQLFDAVGETHSRGIVHRDLKPEHLVITNPDTEGTEWELRLLDFGIAKHTGMDMNASTTQAGLGTPLWTAPEQGRPGYVANTAGDVWALGLITFTLLVGRPYWRHAGDPGSLFDLLNELVFDPIAPASARAAELGFSGTLPPGFDEWFGRCVVRDIAERFADARAAGAALAPVFAACATL